MTFSVADAVIIPTNVDIPVTFKFLVTTSGPIVEPPVIVIPLTIKLFPSKRKLLLSSNSPPVPARTILPDVKSSTLNVFA